MVVTFMSRDLGNHVLCRVCHLVNRIVVFLESRVFSSLSKLLQLALYKPVNEDRAKKC